MTNSYKYWNGSSWVSTSISVSDIVKPAPTWMPLFSRNDGADNFTVSGSWSKTTNSISLTWYGLLSTTPGNYMQWNIWLEPGTYQIDGSSFWGTSFGTGTITLDGAQPITWNQNQTDPGTPIYQRKLGAFVVTTSGLHTIRVTHATGSNFSCHGVFLRGYCNGLIPFPLGDVPTKVSPAWAFENNYKSWTLYSPEFLDFNLGSSSEQAESQTVANIITTLYDHSTHATGTYCETDIFLEAGTYNYDCMALIGTVMGVQTMTINGMAMGTPQAAGTLRLGGVGGHPTTPGNGNMGGSPLTTGQIDLYDACDPVNFIAEDGGHAQDGCIPNALNNIVITSSDFKTVRFTVSGGNSAMVAGKYNIAQAGWFRRIA